MDYEQTTQANLQKYNSTRQTMPGWETKAAYDLALQYALIELHRLAGQHTNDEHYQGIKMSIDIVEAVYHGHK